MRDNQLINKFCKAIRTKDIQDSSNKSKTLTMTTLIRLILVFILFLWTGPIVGQQKIKYGSNNGKYISILNKKIYYEEYGKGTPLILLQGGMGSIEDFALCIPELS